MKTIFSLMLLTVVAQANANNWGYGEASIRLENRCELTYEEENQLLSRVKKIATDSAHSRCPNGMSANRLSEWSLRQSCSRESDETIVTITAYAKFLCTVRM